MRSVATRRVVIAGRDAPLWLAANVIHAALSRAGVVVEVVELPTRLHRHDVLATLPAAEALHNLLGIDESQMLKLTRGAFTLGQRFGGDFQGQPDFFHPYGGVGVPINNQPFIQYWLKARRFGLAVAFEDFSLTAAAAKSGRMTVPDKETSVLGRTDYGYHLPTLAYAGYLKSLAVRRGVALRQTLRLDINLDGETGLIASLTLDNGGEASGDIFIDATGPEALLIGAGLGVERESWRAKFPCDRVLSVGGERRESVPAFAQIRAAEFGWLGFYPTQAGTGLLKAYSSAQLSDEAALRVVASASRLEPGSAVTSASDPGRRRQAWRGNCIAIGEAACSFDPIHNVELQAVQSAIVQLLGLFPLAREYDAERTEYNRLIEASYQRICDFQEAHYALNRYGSSAFWGGARRDPMSASLAHKVETFQARGAIPLLENETFPVESWQSLFLGHGLTPETYSPQVDLTPPEVMKQSFRDILAQIKRTVEKLTSHDAYLEMFCS